MGRSPVTWQHPGSHPRGSSWAKSQDLGPASPLSRALRLVCSRRLSPRSQHNRANPAPTVKVGILGTLTWPV